MQVRERQKEQVQKKKKTAMEKCKSERSKNEKLYLHFFHCVFSCAFLKITLITFLIYIFWYYIHGYMMLHGAFFQYCSFLE